MSPPISILICSKNRRRELLACLESLGRQDYAGAFEVVVAEESGAGTPPEVPLLSFKYVAVEPHQLGYGYPRNIALAAASHELVAFLDDDCEAAPNWLSELVGALADDSAGVAGAVTSREPNALGKCELAAGFPGGGVKYIHESGGNQRSTALLSTCNALMRKSAIESAGGFADGLIHGGEDTLLAARVSSGREAFIYNPRAVVYHRPRGSWRGIAQWFFRRGRARVGLARANRERFSGVLGEFLRNSVMLRFAVVIAISAVIGYWLALPLFAALYYTALVIKYRFLPKAFRRSYGALLLMPLVRWCMDLCYEAGVVYESTRSTS